MIDSGDNIEKRISLKNKILPVSKIIVPDYKTKKKYSKYGYKNIVVKNFPFKKYLIEKYRSLKKEKKLKKIVTFFVVPRSYSLSKNPRFLVMIIK